MNKAQHRKASELRKLIKNGRNRKLSLQEQLDALIKKLQQNTNSRYLTNHFHELLVILKDIVQQNPKSKSDQRSLGHVEITEKKDTEVQQNPKSKSDYETANTTDFIISEYDSPDNANLNISNTNSPASTHIKIS
jgi:hypothetical protein